MKLTINIATRGRPHLLIPTINDALKHIEHPDTKLMVSVDADDIGTLTALRLCEVAKKDRVLISVEPREDTVAGKWNRAIKVCPADVYLPAVDYASYLTPGFDRIAIEAAELFPDNIGVVYGPMANASFPSLQAVTSGWVEKTGYIYPEYFPFWFVDHWLDDVAQLVDRIVYTDVRVDCHSRRPSKTTGLRDLYFWAAFYDSCELMRLREAHAIINSPDFLEREWRKQILLRNHPMIFNYSRWLNQHVRADAQNIADHRGGAESQPDERYLRIKAQAEKLFLANFAEMEAQAA